MLYAELTTVTDVLKHVPESDRNRFSPSGWDAWMKWADTLIMDEPMHRFDIELVHRFYEYDDACEAVKDLGAASEDVDLEDQDACMELLENACAQGYEACLDYHVIEVRKTASGTVLVWAE